MVELFTIGVLLAAFFIWMIMVIPLWVSLMILGSDSGLVKTAVVSLIGVFLQVLVKISLSQAYGGVVAGIAAYLVWVLTIQFGFGLSFIRAIIATILPAILVVALILITGIGMFLLYMH